MINTPVLLFTLAVSVLTSLIFGLLLIGLGVFFLANRFLNINLGEDLWPFAVIGVGALFFVGMLVGGPTAGELAMAMAEAAKGPDRTAARKVYEAGAGRRTALSPPNPLTTGTVSVTLNSGQIFPAHRGAMIRRFDDQMPQ